MAVAASPGHGSARESFHSAYQGESGVADHDIPFEQGNRMSEMSCFESFHLPRAAAAMPVSLATRRRRKVR